MIQHLSFLKNSWYPERYHGSNVDHSFFEGWYFKVEDASGEAVYAFIIGVSMSEDGCKEAFIQTVDGVNHHAQYYKFPYHIFKAATDRFFVQIGENTFSKDQIVLKLPHLEGELRFSNHLTWVKSLLAPNVMGILSYWPFLECNHGLISLRNTVSGGIRTDKQYVSFDGGVGYIEKDWGSSFPKAHIWLQSNRFQDKTTSLSVAIAKMLIAGVEVKGFAAVLMWRGKQFLFSTYNLSTIHTVGSESHMELEFKSREYKLLIKTEYKDSVVLVSPNRTGMFGRVKESLNSVVEITLSANQTKKCLYQDEGANVGLEVFGNWY